MDSAPMCNRRVLQSRKPRRHRRGHKWRLNMRTCYACKQSLPDESFHRGPRIRKCKSCTAIADKNRPRWEYVPSSNWTESARRRKREWASRNRNPSKDRARSAVRRAIENGRIARPESCSACSGKVRRIDGRAAIQAHHHKGYENPLDVQWLCPKCHRKADAAIKEGA